MKNNSVFVPSPQALEILSQVKSVSKSVQLHTNGASQFIMEKSTEIKEEEGGLVGEKQREPGVVLISDPWLVAVC